MNRFNPEMINLPTKILLAVKPMRTQFKFTLRLICTPEYKYTPEYIYTRVFFAHANWTLVIYLVDLLSTQSLFIFLYVYGVYCSILE